MPLGEILLGAGGNLISNVGSALLGNALGRSNEEKMWNERHSPQAQVRNLAAAGINPAVAMGNQSPVLTAGGQMSPVDVSPFGIGTTAISEIGAYLQAKQMAAKTEKETGKVDAETKKLLSELDAQNLQNDLVRQFGKQSWTYDIAQKYENVLLARKTNDIKEQEKAINEFRKTTEYMESQLKGSELTAFKKRLANLDTEIQLSNKLQSEKIATEKSAQSSNYASAEASKATAKNQLSQAEVNKENRRIQAALADFEESAKPYKIVSYVKELKAKNAISQADYEEAVLKLDRLQDVIESRNSSEIYSGVDSFSEWLKGKVSIFGALK